ncbi:MAG: flagellar export protein FliJ [Terriglobia bacterium]
MPFEFPLRGLLRLRKIYEQRERMRLVLLNASRGRVRNELDEVESRRRREFEALELKLQAGLPGGEFRMEEASLQLESGRQRELARLIEALDLQVIKQVDIFWESQKKRKTIESVRERQWQAFHQIEERREQQRIDDLFARRIGARSNDGAPAPIPPIEEEGGP